MAACCVSVGKKLETQRSATKIKGGHVFRDRQRISLIDSLTAGQSVNAGRHCKTLGEFCLTIINHRRGRRTAGVCLLYDNNARPYLRVNRLTSSNVSVGNYPAYSPDLARRVACLFALSKDRRGGKRFADRRRVHTHTPTRQMLGIERRSRGKIYLCRKSFINKYAFFDLCKSVVTVLSEYFSRNWHYSSARLIDFIHIYSNRVLFLCARARARVRDIINEIDILDSYIHITSVKNVDEIL